MIFILANESSKLHNYVRAILRNITSECAMIKNYQNCAVLKLDRDYIKQRPTQSGTENHGARKPVFSYCYRLNIAMTYQFIGQSDSRPTGYIVVQNTVSRHAPRHTNKSCRCVAHSAELPTHDT